MLSFVNTDCRLCDTTPVRIELDIRKICDSLELEYDVVQKFKDVRMKDLKMRVTADTSLEEMIGIQAEWDEDKIKKHLRNEFKKWNSRLTSSKNEEERKIKLGLEYFEKT